MFNSICEMPQRGNYIDRKQTWISGCLPSGTTSLSELLKLFFALFIMNGLSSVCLKPNYLAPYYQSGQPIPSSAGVANPGIKLGSPALQRSYQGSPFVNYSYKFITFTSFLHYLICTGPLHFLLTILFFSLSTYGYFCGKICITQGSLVVQW